MKKLLTVGLLLVASNLQAANFSYNNASISYANVDIEIISGLSIDGDGFDLEGNFAITDNLFIPVRYQSLGFDFGIDATYWAAGIGGHMPINNTMDVFGMAQFGNYEMEVSGTDFDDDILALTVGIRTSLATTAEASVYFTSISFDDDFEDQSGVGAKFNFYVNKTTSIMARAEFLSDTETLGLGVQFDF